MSRSCALETHFQDLPWPLWPVSAHTSAVQSPVRHRVPLLRPSAVGATAARGTSAPLSNSTHALRGTVKVFLQFFTRPSQDFGSAMSYGDEAPGDRRTHRMACAPASTDRGC